MGTQVIPLTRRRLGMELEFEASEDSLKAGLRRKSNECQRSVSDASAAGQFSLLC